MDLFTFKPASMGEQLPSREFSSATLLAGVDLVKKEVGMDLLENKTDDELASELRELTET